jgi:hypothetical protein
LVSNPTSFVVIIAHYSFCSTLYSCLGISLMFVWEFLLYLLISIPIDNIISSGLRLSYSNISTPSVVLAFYREHGKGRNWHLHWTILVCLVTGVKFDMMLLLIESWLCVTLSWRISLRKVTQNCMLYSETEMPLCIYQLYIYIYCDL